jgi:hypothetical protein
MIFLVFFTFFKTKSKFSNLKISSHLWSWCSVVVEAQSTYKIQWSKPLKSGFDPHPSSDTMLRQKSRRYDGYGSYAPLKNATLKSGFDPHPSSNTMLRQKSWRYDGYGSYAPPKNATSFSNLKFNPYTKIIFNSGTVGTVVCCNFRL